MKTPRGKCKNCLRFTVQRDGNDPNDGRPKYTCTGCAVSYTTGLCGEAWDPTRGDPKDSRDWAPDANDIEFTIVSADDQKKST